MSEMFGVNLRKMAKDKRVFTENMSKNFNLVVSAETQIELLKSFSI